MTDRLITPGTLIGPARTEPPAPPIGPHRYVVRLPVPGAARALAFEGLGSEPGNGWLDVTVRLTSAGEWYPVTIGGRRVEVLGDGIDDQYRLRDGALLRSAADERSYAYWLHYGNDQHVVTPVEINATGGRRRPRRVEQPVAGGRRSTTAA